MFLPSHLHTGPAPTKKYRLRPAPAPQHCILEKHPVHSYSLQSSLLNDRFPVQLKTKATI